MYGFTKEDRSSFPYWFAHWCAFQMVALNCHKWKFGYMFHDLYKPWFRLFMNYKKLQMFHNKHSRHHLLYVFLHGMKHVDWEGMIIDWECSRFTKQAAQLNARDEKERIIATLRSLDLTNKTVRQLYELGLTPNRDNYFEWAKYNETIDFIEANLNKALKDLNL